MHILEGNAMRTVFMVYAGFWLVVVVGLFAVVGMLVKKQERRSGKGAHGGGQ